MKWFRDTDPLMVAGIFFLYCIGFSILLLIGLIFGAVITHGVR